MRESSFSEQSTVSEHSRPGLQTNGAGSGNAALEDDSVLLCVLYSTVFEVSRKQNGNSDEETPSRNEQNGNNSASRYPTRS